MRHKYTVRALILLIFAFIPTISLAKQNLPMFSISLANKYFPLCLMKVPLIEQRYRLSWFAYILESMKEPPLWPLVKKPNQMSYRFILGRGRQEPIILRLDRSPKGAWVLSIKKANSAAVVKNNLKLWASVHKKRTLTKQEAEQFHRLFDALEFWTLPSPPPLETNQVLDGSTWAFEAVEKGQYNVVWRILPKDDNNWYSDPHIDREREDLKGNLFIDRATYLDVNKKLVGVCEFLLERSDLNLKTKEIY